LGTEREALLIRDDDVLSRFDGVVERCLPGSYPGLEWMEKEGERLGDKQNHRAAWVLMSPQNFSVSRDAFLESGGFDEALCFCEGWDLVLRLCSAGLPLVRLGKAPIYHLYHYRPVDFDAHLKRWRAIRQIAAKHRHRAIELVLILFGIRGHDRWLPVEMGPASLDEFGELLELYRADDIGPYERVLQGHPLYSEIHEVLGRRDPAP
jgi:GT2 family glycosyltransferase